MENTKLLITPAEVTTPAKLLALAMQDIEIAFKSGIKILMLEWVDVSPRGYCEACLAGCMLLVEQLVTPELVQIEPENLWPAIEKQQIGAYNAADAALALNAFRTGNIVTGLNYLGIPTEEGAIEKPMLRVPARVETEAELTFFLAEMETVRALLEQLGY